MLIMRPSQAGVSPEVFWNGSTFAKDTTVNPGSVYTDIEYRGVADAYMLTRKRRNHRDQLLGRMEHL